MSKVQFPKQTFKQALTVTKKIKTNLKPFLEEYAKGNIPWVFQSIAILFHNLTDPSVEPFLKMNSMFAVKCIIDTCEYVPHAFIQTYILPIIKAGAITDATLPENERGFKLFSTGVKAAQKLQNFGYNYVKLCTELVKVLAVMKPRKLFYNNQTQDPSEYALVNFQVQKMLKYPVQDLVFFKEDPANLNALYTKKLVEFEEKSEDYMKFVEQKFTQQVKIGFKDVILDIRSLIKSGDCYIFEDVMQIASDIILKAKSCNIIKIAINFVNSLVISGNFQAMLFMHNSEGIKKLVKEVIKIEGPNKSVSRGQNFLMEKKGTPEERRALYIEFLRALELWAKVFTQRSIKDDKVPSKVARYYQILKEDYKFEFPDNPFLAKQIKQTQENYRRNQNRNQTIKKQIISEVPDEEDDSIILSKLPMESNTKKNKAQEPASNKNLNLESKQSLNQERRTDLKQAKETPGASQKDDEICRLKIKNVQDSIANITSNQRNLPTNMKTIQQELSTLLKLIEHGNFTDDKQAQKFITKEIDLEQQFEKIKTIYGDYKANKIDFKKFCTRVNTNLPSSHQNNSKAQIESNLAAINESQSVREPSHRELPQQSNRSRLKEGQNVEHKINIQNPHQEIDAPFILKQQPVIHINEIQQASAPSQQQLSHQSKKNLSHTQNRPDQRSYGGLPEHLPSDVVTYVYSTQSQNKPQVYKAKYGSKNYIEKEHPKQLKTENQNHLKQSKKVYQGESQQLSPKVEFQRSQFNQSRFANSIKTNKEFNSQPAGDQINAPFILGDQRKPKIEYGSGQQIFTLSREQISIEPENPHKQFYRKFAKNQEQQSRIDYQPVTYSKQYPLPSNENLASPIKVQYMRIQGTDEPNYQILDDDEFIEGPSLNPMSYSYHDFNEALEKKNNKTKTFKEAINNENMLIKTNKRENLYWLQTESNSLIRPVNNSQKKSKVESRINVPELLEERSKKYEMEIKLMEQSKDRKIRELENRLNIVEHEKSTISEELKARQLQIRSIRENSQVDAKKSKTDQFSFIDDQNFLMKKLAQASMPQNQNQKRLGESLKSQSRILTSGQIINTKVFAKYFQKFNNEKQKKVHMKNKQLLYKDNDIQIGYMSHLQGRQYKITCFVTPESNFLLQQIHIQNDDNLKIEHNLKSGLEIIARKQERANFIIDVLTVPYIIPEVTIYYKLNQTRRQTKFMLPCAFHKFFTIQPVDQFNLLQQFQNNSIVRGQEIPYSKKVLKNIDLLQDFLPHIEKLNRGLPNQLGQVCFGGQAHYKNCKFPIKISVKPNQFLYIQAIDKSNEEGRKIIDFYVATLNHFLMKDISWN